MMCKKFARLLAIGEGVSNPARSLKNRHDAPSILLLSLAFHIRYKSTSQSGVGIATAFK